jgi:drug/metabolite transporter (DMT)-like permease
VSATTEATIQLWIAVPAAVGSALSFGLTGALQHTAAMRVAARPALRPRLLLDLGRQRIWLLSLGANALGTVLQLLALATGPLVLVQPVLVSGLLFAVLIRSRLAHRRPPAYALVGASLCAAGLAVFLLLSRPTGGRDWLSFAQALPLAAGLAAVLVVCLAIASRFPGERRAFALAGGAGVLYGVTAGVAKLAIGVLQTGGVLALLTNWPLYALAVIGPLGFLLNQNAYQADQKMAPALAIITVTDPLVGIGVGVLWLGEELQPGVGPVLGQVVALAALIAGVALLSHGAPQVPHHHNRSQPED